MPQFRQLEAEAGIYDNSCGTIVPSCDALPSVTPLPWWQAGWQAGLVVVRRVRLQYMDVGQYSEVDEVPIRLDEMP